MNFKPKIKKYSKINTKFKHKLLKCKNLIFILLILECLGKNFSKINDKKFSYGYVIFKKKKNVGSIIRAPYKNKTSQFKLKLSRYYINLKISFYINNNIIINNLNEFFFIIKNLIKTFYYFESTLITQSSRGIFLPITININVNNKNIN